jgi:Met-10+ like-protein
MISLELEQRREAWNNIAAGYDEFVTHTEVWLANEALRRAKLRPGERFLDVAAGCGGLSLPAARLGAKVVATDWSPAMIQLLESRAQRGALGREDPGHGLPRARPGRRQLRPLGIPIRRHARSGPAARTARDGASDQTWWACAPECLWFTGRDRMPELFRRSRPSRRPRLRRRADGSPAFRVSGGRP